MIISVGQLLQLSNIKVEEFVKKTIIFLSKNFPEWVNGKDEAQLKEYIHTMIDFGKRYKITKGVNIQKLIAYDIFYKFDIVIHGKLNAILTEYKFSEKKRMENFYSALQSKTYLLH